MSAAGGLMRVVLGALSAGCSVLPCGLNKRPLIPEWTSLQTVRPTIEQVEHWHTELHPPAWGLITGPISQRVVFDFDGIAGLATAQKYGIRFHIGTPSGGGHQYLQCPDFYIPTISNATKTSLRENLPGVDLRGSGGYAIFCGQNETGVYRRLRSLTKPDPWEGPLVDALMPIIAPPKPAEPLYASACSERVSAEYLLNKYLSQAQGGAGRNDVGLQLCLQLRDNNFSEDEAAAIMRRYAASVGTTNTKGQHEPYTEAEVLATVRSVYSRPPRNPWGRRADRHDEAPPKAEGNVEQADRRQTQAGSLVIQPFFRGRYEACPLAMA